MFGGTADKINDGNVNGDFFAGSCYFSAPQQGSNMVKLATKGPIGSVSVYPRTDAYMMETIDGALVRKFLLSLLFHYSVSLLLFEDFEFLRNYPNLSYYLAVH